MTEYKNFFEISGVRIEVEGKGGASKAYARDFFETFQKIASGVATQMNNIPEDQRPTDFMISFGLRALADGGFAISLSETNANFRISMKWGGYASDLVSESLPSNFEL